jgi:hypothetical protein
MMVCLADPYQWIGLDHLVPNSYRVWVPGNPTGDAMRAKERAYAHEYLTTYWSPVNQKLAAALSQANEYYRATELTACAVGDAPVVVTNYNWATYIRGFWSQVWVDSKGRTEYEPPIDPATWERVETLVYPGTVGTAGTFLNFPQTTGPYDVSRYAALMDRLPVTVEIQESSYRWNYLGGERLADCAAKFGYAKRSTAVGTAQLLAKPQP